MRQYKYDIIKPKYQAPKIIEESKPLVTSEIKPSVLSLSNQKISIRQRVQVIQKQNLLLRNNNNPTVRLFVQKYTPNNQSRNKQLQMCLKLNNLNPLISVICINNQQRVNYSQFFKVANSHIKNQTDITIIANSDIAFDQSISNLYRLKNNQACCLSRIQYSQVIDNKIVFDKDHIKNTYIGQDAWIFRGKIRDVQNCNFGMGIWQCDSAIAHRLKATGYQLLNPCKNVRSFHLHKSGYRTNQHPSVPGPYYDGITWTSI